MRCFVSCVSVKRLLCDLCGHNVTGRQLVALLKGAQAMAIVLFLSIS